MSDQTYEIRIGSRVKGSSGFARLADAKRCADQLRAGRPRDNTPIVVVAQSTGAVAYEAPPLGLSA
jgi:hypothetical protein